MLNKYLLTGFDKTTEIKKAVRFFPSKVGTEAARS